MFVTLADHYVTSIIHGDFPDVDNAFLSLSKLENARVQRYAVDSFEKEMAQIKLPVAGSELTSLYTKAQHKALEYLWKNTFEDNDEHDRQAEVRYSSTYNYKKIIICNYVKIGFTVVQC